MLLEPPNEASPQTGIRIAVSCTIGEDMRDLALDRARQLTWNTLAQPLDKNLVRVRRTFAKTLQGCLLFLKLEVSLPAHLSRKRAELVSEPSVDPNSRQHRRLCAQCISLWLEEHGAEQTYLKHKFDNMCSR